MTLPLPYRTLQSLIHLNARRSNRWWLTARPAWRLVRVAVSALREQLDIPFNHKDPATIPAYLRADLRSALAAMENSLAAWTANATEWRDSPTLCTRCGAPRSDFDGEKCSRCP